MPEARKTEVTLVNSRYQPTKEEPENPIEFLEGTTPEDVARAVMRDTKIRRMPQPE